MDITSFAEMTYTVLKKTPFQTYIPTLCLPERSEIHALQGIPEEEECRMREIVMMWAESTANDDEEFLVAYRDGTEHFRIIHRHQGSLQQGLYPVKPT